ncbi:RICIN domain-containing protein [Streptomyces sp. NPDC046557]|uniref:RICIN domain-containing protein n=1 Tax=Streptomyces sp. NPDC046557 TaxID=3155372 RepID=UPI0033CB5311
MSSLLILGLAPVGTSAGDCDNFPGGICPTFGDPRRPPDFGDGWWNIKSAYTQDLILTTPWDLNLRPRRNRVILQPYRNEQNQQFRFRRINGMYQIEVRATGLCLEGSKQPDGKAIVRQNDCNTPSNVQTWVIEPRPKGYFLVKEGNRPSGRCLDAASASRTAPPQGAYLQEFSCHDGDNQAWVFEDASPPPAVH